jgi:hypothetical protein
MNLHWLAHWQESGMVSTISMMFLGPGDVSYGIGEEPLPDVMEQTVSTG